MSYLIFQMKDCSALEDLSVKAKTLLLTFHAIHPIKFVLVSVVRLCIVTNNPYVLRLSTTMLISHFYKAVCGSSDSI